MTHPAALAPEDLERLTGYQRQADLGDGTFLNPVFAGDRPDPSVLRDGEDYYLHGCPARAGIGPPGQAAHQHPVGLPRTRGDRPQARESARCRSLVAPHARG